MSKAIPLRQKSLQPHLALIAVQLMFGTWPIIGKIALRVLPSTGLVFFRVTGAAVAFTLIRIATRRPTITRKSDYARLALYSLLGVVINQFLFVKGLALSTVVNATILGTSIPAFTLLVSILLGKEKFSTRAAIGTLVAAAGVIYLVDPFRADFSGDKTLGNLLLVANTIAYGAYIAVSQDVFKRYGALTAISWVFTFGCVAAIPLGGYYLAQTPLRDLSLTIWLAVLYIILVPTVGAYYLNAWALARVAPSTVAVYIYLQPLIAFALAPLVLGDDERWNSRTWMAAALIFTGVALVTWRARSRVMEEVSEHPDALGH
ncbi:MAG: DMT family transporter [Acidobacteria bacterium]|nr:DMT family transporter [Acidobacteriota bacterium]